MLRGVPGFRGAGDEGRVGKEEQLAPHLFLGLGHAFFVRGTGMEEVELVQYDQAGLFLLKDELGDLAVLRGNARREVDNKDAKIGTADRFFRTDCGEDLDGVVALAARAQAGGVDQGEIFAHERVG